jgi:putative salt-induced outer membrane protein YdiY
MRTRSLFASLTAVSFATTLASSVRAEAPAESPKGPQADIKAVVAAPKDPGDAPSFAKPTDGSSATASAGALMQTGNSYMLAGTANGAYERHFGDNSVGAAAIGNYGESRPPGGENRATTQNIQGKLRYDRYLTDDLTAFMMLTGRSDRFQGVEFRLNVDPGVKYLFLNQNTTAFWGEAGYDFQYDVRRNDARQDQDSSGKPLFNKDGSAVLIDKTATDHAARLYAGFKYAFNSDVTTKAGVEYLQSVIDSGRYRVNFDALVAAKLKGGLAMGVGFSARYDHAPLPGKEELDTSTSLNLIYSFADPSPKKDNCPCEPPPEAAPPAPSAGAPPPPPPEGAAPPTTPPPAPASTPPAPNGASK